MFCVVLVLVSLVTLLVLCMQIQVGGNWLATFSVHWKLFSLFSLYYRLGWKQVLIRLMFLKGDAFVICVQKNGLVCIVLPSLGLFVIFVLHVTDLTRGKHSIRSWYILCNTLFCCNKSDIFAKDLFVGITQHSCVMNQYWIFHFHCIRHLVCILFSKVCN